jgi:hypothetical protein
MPLETCQSHFVSPVAGLHKQDPGDLQKSWPFPYIRPTLNNSVRSTSKETDHVNRSVNRRNIIRFT